MLGVKSDRHNQIDNTDRPLPIEHPRSWLPGAAAVRVDLHCHTTFSDERIKWLPGLLFHPVSTPTQVYDLAKSRGMDFVTITDHDTIDGCLSLLDERGPLPDFLIGEEVTVAFPEDGTIVHVNVYDHNEAQHAEIQKLRGSLYELVGYLRSIDKLYVINHLTWTAQHRVLKPWQIEKMLELFDIFEGLNGTRSYAHNAFVWEATHAHHKILVAGSDSHTTRVGTTHTVVGSAVRTSSPRNTKEPAAAPSGSGAMPTAFASARSSSEHAAPPRSVADLLAAIRAGQTAICGEFGTADKLRDDIWQVLHSNAERILSHEHRAWARVGTRVVERLARSVTPLACLGYLSRQNRLIRRFHAALAT